MGVLLSAFSPSQGTENTRFLELSNIVSVIEVARRLGIADLTPLGQSLLINYSNEGGPALLRSRTASRRDQPLNGSNTSPGNGKKELQFHAMILAPHQIELIFVLCTLLSGKRKIGVQKKLAKLGIAKVLRDMYDRMSWDAPPLVPESIEHIHGPDCECNPESAVRVQFLRLIHNFFDRDFLGNPNKLLILSASEQDLVLHCTDSDSIREGIQRLRMEDRGTLSQIVRTLIREPSDSVYRFWLSACIENFLRGCGQVGQLFVAHSGILHHVTQHIVKSIPSSNNSLQTAFDLMVS
jgi:Trpc4-associated protein